MSTFTHSSDRPVNYAAVWRRPPHHARRTATTVLAGNYGWFDCEDLLALHTDKATPDSSAVSESSAPQSAVQPPVTSQPILQETNHERRTSSAGATATTSTAKGGRGKAKAKAAPSVTRPVDMGVSIIPICSPGTGTPRPSPEPPSPPPHPHRRPPHSFASTSSASGRPDFDAGAQRAVEDTPAGATVGKRSRRPSQSQRPRLPISPPVTSPNTSTSELPPLTGVSELDDIASRLTITTAGTKRTRNGREIVRRKRRKTETRGEAPPVAVKKEEHVENAVRRRAPAQRKGWKGWVMVSDTEASDAERGDTPPVVILDRKTRSGRDFDQDLAPRVNRRGRSTASARSGSVATSAAPLSSATTTT
ncbi:hypothetical protein RhiJN_14885 [Ceratobasidium sp. AG-Ba]|nr:hypothetical protein RhiJN_14885 [Ceratobasidium sp. AG-Ba]QRW15422.1 hypothetical protein RhiLY_14421 [Ceratobasidium sp. AG-Ba]